MYNNIKTITYNIITITGTKFFFLKEKSSTKLYI